MKILGIKFAPLNVPLKRRLETLSVTLWYFTLAFGPSLGFIITGYLLFFTTTIRYYVLLYFLWMYYDWDTCNKGGRSTKLTNMVAKSRWIQHVFDFFPVTLVKTTDLDPNRNYLLCSFPHGIIPAGAAGSFQSESRGAKTLFPGLQLNIIVQYQVFKSPIFREIALAMGFISSSEESLDYQLSTKPKTPFTGRISVLIVGGAGEAMECSPGTNRVLVNQRKGFVRVALKHGETDTYDQVKNPYLSLVQHYFRKNVGLVPLILKGRGFFQYSYGFVPHRVPITTVVGSPIEIPKISHPTKEQINEYHKLFVEKLTELFETHKYKYLPDADSKHLEFV
ncbi:2-acylglycerol O-acyltransferase 2-A-like isoform X2 [Megachile rotundata]|uniref:2-acylglycerol O-acyltransferase 2-A-like isoform X2 n=1 Tax=Megachile rotundata TaxID=143995 RepID=UPI0006150D76|nr:PREDICTED: 2-acylglycerol O-acyltransferase 2-A-like isoform X2 [Megachile rotundata]